MSRSTILATCLVPVPDLPLVPRAAANVAWGAVRGEPCSRGVQVDREGRVVHVMEVDVERLPQDLLAEPHVVCAAVNEEGRAVHGQ